MPGQDSSDFMMFLDNISKKQHYQREEAEKYDNKDLETTPQKVSASNFYPAAKSEKLDETLDSQAEFQRIENKIRREMEEERRKDEARALESPE